MASPERPDLSLVVPFYNPGPVVRRTVERASRALASSGVTYEIIAVSDGSTDDSEQTLAGLLPGVLETVTLETNRGKGFAVRSGMRHATGRFVGFIDADGDIPPEILPEFAAAAAQQHADIAYGSKRHPASSVEVPLVRRLYSWGYRSVVRALFHLSVPDTQTGIKLVRAEVLEAVLPAMAEERFAFDLELFVLAQRLGFDRFIELPVRVDKQYSTTVSFRSVGSILWDTLNIWWRLCRPRASRRPLARLEMETETREGDLMDPGSGVPQEDPDPR